SRGLSDEQFVELYRGVLHESGMFEDDVRPIFIAEFCGRAQLLPAFDKELFIEDLSAAIVESIRLDDPQTLDQVYQSLVEAGIMPDTITVSADTVALYLVEFQSVLDQNPGRRYSPREIAHLLGSTKILAYFDKHSR